MRPALTPSPRGRGVVGYLLVAGGVGLMASGCRPGDGLSDPLPPPTRTGYYVTSDGTPGGSGSGDDPWDLATALAGAGGRIQPGDTVWLRRGVYRGFFRASMNGTPAEHVVFRQYPGERATIDGGLRGDGSYLTFWGFEIMQSNPTAAGDRVLSANTVGGRFVNLILHDAGISGVSLAADKGEGVELYGCLVYNNGTHENIDHGIYAHNATAGTKFITDNVFFNNYARGIQVYSDGGVLQNVRAVGNVAFNNGSISAGSTPVNLLISAPVATSGMVAADNLLYASPGTNGINLRLGDYDANYNGDIVVQGNYAAGGAAGLQLRHRWTRATIADNTFLASAEVVQTGGSLLTLGYTWSGNRYYRDPAAAAWEHDSQEHTFAEWRAQTGLGGADQVLAGLPTGPHVVVRPNRYEAGRAHVVVYNWARAPSVAVDLSQTLVIGDVYEIRNVQDFFGPPVATGTYGGGTVTVSMAGVAPPAPIGRVAPNSAPRTGPDFDVFVVVRVPT